MSATVEPRFPWSFQGGNNPSWTLKYTVFNAASESEAKNALAATAPATYDGLIRDSYSADEEDNGTWLAEVRYVKTGSVPKLQQPGSVRRSFDTGGGTQHITQSLETKMIYCTGDFPAEPDFQGAIGATKDSVEGCDIVMPAYRFSETRTFPTGDVDATYIGKLYRLTGKVNNGTFKGFAAHEVLFLGASGSDRDDANTEITFNFEAKPNRTGQTIGEIADIDFDGWDYVWVLYRPKEDTDAKALVQRPVGVFVERVYDEDNFSDLGIGT